MNVVDKKIAALAVAALDLLEEAKELNRVGRELYETAITLAIDRRPKAVFKLPTAADYEEEM